MHATGNALSEVLDKTKGERTHLFEVLYISAGRGGEISKMYTCPRTTGCKRALVFFTCPRTSQLEMITCPEQQMYDSDNTDN